MTTNNTHTVDELLDVIQSTLDGFAADLCGSGPNEVFAAQGEVEHVRRLFAQQEHEIALLSAKMRSLSAISQGAMDRTDLARAEIERLRAKVDDLRERLVEHGLPTNDREDALALLGQSRAIEGWYHDDDRTLQVRVTPGREREVLATMAAAGLQPVSDRVTEDKRTMLVFSTAGGEE